MDGLSLECGAERIGVWNLLGDTAEPPQSVIKSSSYGILLVVLRRRVVSSPAHEGARLM